MIDRQGGILIFECDACEETFDGATSDFASVWRSAKAAGWQAYKTPADEWLHACPSPACRTACYQMTRG